MREYRNVIIGSGYSGLNAYYGIRDKKGTLLIDSTGNFIYHSKQRDIAIEIPQATRERVDKIDINNHCIYTENSEYCAENIVIATGCNRQNQIEFMKNENIYRNKYLGSANEYDDYILLQFILKLNMNGINAGYSGNFLAGLGENVAAAVRDFLMASKIPIAQEPDFIFPRCRPALFENFIKVDENFMAKDGLYAIGDIIDSDIRSGELSMRQGAFVGKHINGNGDNFKPVFIVVLDNFKGTGIRIKSRYPWGMKEASTRTGYLYSLMPEFLIEYYRLRRGKMGFISVL
ncbi:MAG: hypothetical protein RE471_00955 [Ferroplasma sp.]|uniref:hypothetical protein n=1 Tax=Ferroplasma sp. TaxID=2591003 RepID=UPI0028162518|nr:hypothetical protein [Ferroplasma sp.]WMT51465.1 MAG: hypothetical protein RE471_00955 [Ferroplasma sp.]